MFCPITLAPDPRPSSTIVLVVTYESSINTEEVAVVGS